MKYVLLLSSLFLAACNQDSNPFHQNSITSVDLIREDRVLNTVNANKIMHILKSTNKIKEHGFVARHEWDYKIRLNSKNSNSQNILWLYSSKTGTIIRLTKVKTPLYQITEVAHFNHLLGIK